MRTMVDKVKCTQNHRQTVWKPWVSFTMVFTLVEAHLTIDRLHGNHGL